MRPRPVFDFVQTLKQSPGVWHECPDRMNVPYLRRHYRVEVANNHGVRYVRWCKP